ncbi:chromate transporter [Mycoplasma sp. 128]
MQFVSFLAACGLVLASAFIVFGGGQVFMPIYKWIYEFLSQHFSSVTVNSETIDQVFAVANATPGVIGTKLALFTGYLISIDDSGNAQWWGYIAMLVTYLIIVVPAIVIMHYSAKALAKSKSSKYFKNLNIILKPVLAGVMFSLAVQLFIGTTFPMIKFNDSTSYIVNVSSSSTHSKLNIFKGWRLIVLFIYSPIAIVATIYLQKRRVPLLFLILSSIVLGLLLFQPWLIK